MPEDPAPPPPPPEALTDRAARDRCAKSVFKDCGPAFNNPVLLIGDEPFEAHELAAFLRALGIKTYVVRPQGHSTEGPDADSWSEIVGYRAPVVVLGRTKWFCLALASLIADECITATPLNKGILYEMACYWLERQVVNDEVTFRRSPECRNLSFIPQEMLLDRLLSRQPVLKGLPFKKGATMPEVLVGFEQFLKECLVIQEAFRWPNTNAPTGRHGIGKVHWALVGLLSYIGYNVGTNGKLRVDRQHILRRLFEREKLPLVQSAQYLAQWGSSKSATRLRKIAESIAMFCRNAKGRLQADMKRTIENYEDDLAWLKKSFYDGRFDGSFRWPQT